MSCVEDAHKPAGLINGAHTLLDEIRLLKEMQDHPGLFFYNFLNIIARLFIL